MISVIVLTYNQEQYIAQTLDGILMQQVDESMEIVIGNDCSTDNTQTICEDYRKRYPNMIRLYYNSPNLGLVQNFIEMVRKCKGEYIALCDGDDYWIDEYKLQKQVDILRKEANCVLVHTHRTLLSDVEINQPALDIAIAESASELFFRSYICVPTVLFRAKVLYDWIEEYAKLSIVQDWRMQDFPLWLYLGTKGTFKYISESTAIYRVLPNTLSREINKERGYRFDKSIIRIKSYFRMYYMNNNESFISRFREMEFHTRKRMLLNYGWIAREQIWPLLKLIPYYPIIVYRSIARKLIKQL